MPRPGPRPYDCIRRAWHSDRHQPVRGLLIQEIFRIVCEIHSQSTKKNTEWQEKLPVVVLRAEEIMYSKANSEAEYMDMKTLLDRTNDAINTIIRLDEATETGEFLKPCIEAALHLGCTPRRATRSQRNINPRCYLSQDSTTYLDNIFMKPNSFSPVMTFHKDVQRSHREKCPVSVSSKYSTYPLCYSFQVPSLPISNNVTDSCKSKNRPASGLDAINGITFGGCDLSLRLGPLGDIRSPTQKRSKVSSSNNNNNFNS
uniref:Histone acetyltransferase n=1 Tax=Noccaea caerulescens TaxID=107243 RepID=A0A1J3IY13_NOCCA